MEIRIIQTSLGLQCKLARPIRPWFKVLTDSIRTFHSVVSLVGSSLILESTGHVLYTNGVSVVFITHET